MFAKKENPTKIYFATDIHGSEMCWKKMVNAGEFYDVDLLILGGDITGKGIQVLLQTGPSRWRTDFLGERVDVSDKGDLERFEKRVRAAGFYPYQMDSDELIEFQSSEDYREQLFERLMTESIQRWLEFAEDKLKGSGRRIIVTAGNDDPLFIDGLFGQSSVVVMAERQVMWLDDDHEMINEGFSNPTPWNTHREMEEEELYQVIEQQIAQVENVESAVFNLHAVPYNTKLDEAPKLDENLVPVDGGRTYIPVGSKAVREIIEKYQPLLGLHGHIHEGKGSAKIGRTLCLNPGSNYTAGILSGYLVFLDKKGIRGFQPTQG
jgi:hypothetical protein